MKNLLMKVSKETQHISAEILVLIVHIFSGLNYYGGDIILTDWQKKMLEGKEDEAHIIKDGDVTEEVSNERAHNVNRRAVVKNGAYLWPKGIVPYVIDNTLSKLLFCMSKYKT